MTLAPFIERYKPVNTVPATQEVIDAYRDIVPDSLIEIWQQHGFGKYGDGIIELVNPQHYEDTLAMWLAKRADNYVPFAITAFGELFYYRRLTVEDEDVCMLDPHYRDISVETWDLIEFFNEYLMEEEVIEDTLRKKLLDQAVAKLGALAPGDIYIFIPALCLGGADEIEYVDDIGKALIHLDILFQLG